MKKHGSFENDLYLLPNTNMDDVKSFPLHYHRHVEFLYITEGECEMDIGSKRYTVKEGDVAFIAPFIMHSYVKHSECRRYIAVFEPECYGFLGEFLIKNHPVCPIISYADIEKSFPDILQRLSKANSVFRCEKKSPKNRIKMMSILYGVLSDCIGLMSFESSEHMYDDTYLGALRLCCDKFSDEGFDLAAISAALGVSPSTVQKLFAKNMRMGVKEYINYLRVGNAHSLLQSTDIPISDIALSSGFGTIRSFNRAFQRFRGCTPGEARAKSKQ